MNMGQVDFYTKVCTGALIGISILGVTCNVSYMVHRMYLGVGDLFWNILWYLVIASPFAAVLIHLLSLKA